MSVDNVEIARATYEQFARGDFSAFEDWSDDFEFVTSPELPDAGTYRGEEARRWARNWVEAFEGLTMEATEIIDAGDKVVVGILQRGRFRGSQAMTRGTLVERADVSGRGRHAIRAVSRAGPGAQGRRAIGVAALDEKRYSGTPGLCVPERSDRRRDSNPRPSGYEKPWALRTGRCWSQATGRSVPAGS